MVDKGSNRNAQKVNIKRVEEAIKQENDAKQEIKYLRSLPVFARSGDYDELLRQANGRLSRAIAARKRSENHSRQGKGGRR